LRGRGEKNNAAWAVQYRMNDRMLSGISRPVGKADMAGHRKQTKDRRVQKTIGLLHAALGGLIHEKPYDEIVVQEILDRANVGRSTFYMHFRDKDELLISGVRDVLESVQAPTEPPSSGRPYRHILSFGLPVFEHIHHHRHAGTAMMDARGRAVVHERLQTIVAERIAEDVRTHVQGRRSARAKIPQNVLVQYLASTFILVLNWWAESRTPLPPKEADALFRALVMPTLSSALL
jgi:AcrR family transcriptional regulator